MDLYEIVKEYKAKVIQDVTRLKGSEYHDEYSSAMTELELVIDVEKMIESFNRKKRSTAKRTYMLMCK